MRCLHLFLFSCLFLLSNYVCNNPRSIPLSPFISRHTKYLPTVNEKLNIKIDINSYDSLNFLFLGSGFVALLALLYLHLCNYVRYVTFNTNLTLCRKRNITSNSPQCIRILLSLLLIGLLLIERPDNLILLVIYPNPNYGILDYSLKFRKRLSQTIFLCFIHVLHSNVTGCLHSMPFCSAKLVSSVCEKCSNLVISPTHYFGKRCSFESWTYLSK